MDNQPWDKAKLEEWKRFWESEMGKEAIKKIQSIKEQCLSYAMQQADPNSVTFYVGRAGGADLVLQDIQAGFDALEALGKEEKAAKK